MKRGEIVEIAAGASYARQWLVQGSGREPYKVSLTKNGIFQCGCPAGRTTPGGMAADPCKHVLAIQIRTGVGLALPQSAEEIHIPVGLRTEAEVTGRRFR